MESRPKAPEVEAVLAGLDQSWQELVKLLKEGHRKATPQGLDAQETVASGGDLQEDRAPSPDLDRVRQWISPAPEEVSAKQPEEPASAPTPEPTREKSPSRGWGQGFFNIAILLLLAVSLAGLLFLFSQTQGGRGQVDAESLTIRGKDGVVRAWLGERDGQVSLCLLDKDGRSRAQMTLDADGSPSLTLLDELQKNRLALRLGAGGEPQLTEVKEPETATPGAQAPAPPAGEAAPPAAALPESPGSPKAPEGPAAAPPDQSQAPGTAQPEAAGTNAPAAEPTGKFVGSKTSNKYHYPECRWAKKIKPERLLNFGSVGEARGKGYIPCPACQPPAR